jgi:membrane fusion protein (multidrug efflux system)
MAAESTNGERNPADTPASGNGVPAGRSGKRIALAMFLLVTLAVIGSGVGYWLYKQTHIDTDDAFVDGRIHLVSSRIPGTVVQLLVEDNQPVKQGDPLLRIDAEPYAVRESGAQSGIAIAAAEIAAAKSDVAAASADFEAARRDVDAARRDLEASKAQLAQARTAIDASKARIALAEAQLAQAGRDADRAKALFDRGAVSRERQEKAQTALDVARAQASLAKEELRIAEAAVPTQQALVSQREAMIAQKEARAVQVRSGIAQRQARVSQQEAGIAQRRTVLDEAKLNRRYTELVAPAAGFVTRRNVEVGQVVAPGQPLLAVTALDNLWIVANFKETQLGKIHPGQRVRIVPDSHRGSEFSGRVDSIMAGTGSAFSLFPPENATGNYVKVVQRVPVKIVLDPGEDPGRLLRIGMSVVPTVLVK